MKRRLALLLTLSLLITSLSFALPAERDYAKVLVDYGIIQGDANGNLHGEKVLNRAESVAILARMMGADETARNTTATDNFSDVPSDNWAAGYIAYALKMNWTKGVGGNQFGLNDNVTLQQFTTLMLRALGYNDNVYDQAMTMATDKSLLTDVTAKTPTAELTRKDAFALMYNTLQQQPKGKSEKLVDILGLTSKQIVEATKYPLTIKNYDGSDLVIKAKPQRIASLILGTDELLLELVDPSRIVGLSGQVGNSKSVSLAAKKATNFPKLKNNFEVILQNNPDLIIGSSWVKKELLAQINDSDIDYYGYKSPNTIEEQIAVIRNFSTLLGERAKGEAIIADWNKRMTAIKEKAATIATKDVLSVLPYSMHDQTNAKGTIVDEIIGLIGAKNAATEAGLEKRAKISKEKIIEINPDVILIMAWGKDDLDEFNNFVKDMKNDPSLQNLKAIKNDRIIVEDGRYMTIVTQHLIEGIEFVAESVYPDVYGQ